MPLAAVYKPVIEGSIYWAFWNMIGAGNLGFIFDPPASQYDITDGYLIWSTARWRWPCPR